MALIVEKYLQGLAPQEHMARMKVNRERFSQVHAAADIPPEDAEYFATLPSPLRVAVITEDWCGDHVSTTPVLYRLAEATGGKLEVRTFMRDRNWDLARDYLPENRVDTVPVFVFFTGEDMRQIGLFIETAPELVPTIDGMEEAIRNAHPEVPDIRKDVNEMSQETRTLLRQERGSFRVNHAGEWARVISRDIRQVVAAGLARKPGEEPAQGGTKWPPD
jgi:hypothetical protein